MKRYVVVGGIAGLVFLAAVAAYLAGASRGESQCIERLKLETQGNLVGCGMVPSTGGSRESFIESDLGDTGAGTWSRWTWGDHRRCLRVMMTRRGPAAAAGTRGER